MAATPAFCCWVPPVAFGRRKGAFDVPTNVLAVFTMVVESFKEKFCAFHACASLLNLYLLLRVVCVIAAAGGLLLKLPPERQSPQFQERLRGFQASQERCPRGRQGPRRGLMAATSAYPVGPRGSKDVLREQKDFKYKIIFFKNSSLHKKIKR